MCKCTGNYQALLLSDSLILPLKDPTVPIIWASSIEVMIVIVGRQQLASSSATVEMSTRKRLSLCVHAVYCFSVFVYSTILIKYVTQWRINIQDWICRLFKPDPKCFKIKFRCICTFSNCKLNAVPSSTVQVNAWYFVYCIYWCV